MRLYLRDSSEGAPEGASEGAYEGFTCVPIPHITSVTDMMASHPSRRREQRRILDGVRAR